MSDERQNPGRFTVRRLMVAVGLAALVLSAFRGPPSMGDAEAIRIAADHARRSDPSFLPEAHTARAYRPCGRSPWYVDFFPADGDFVVLRVWISVEGGVRSSAAFREDERVESGRTSPPKYVLDREGSVVAAAIP